MAKHYGEDLAYIHDVGFGHFARDAAPGLLDILRRAGIVDGRVIDLGCGSGLWARELSRAGYEVVGCDISAAMLVMARERVPEATFRRTSFVKAALPSCDAITAIGEVFSYLFDDNVSEQKLKELFQRIHKILRPGGLLIFDVAEPSRGSAKGQQRQNWSANDWALMLQVDEDTTRRELTRRMTIFRKVGRLYRRNEELHRLRLYKASEMTTMLRSAGFRVRTVRSYGDMRFPHGLVGFIARRP